MASSPPQAAPSPPAPPKTHRARRWVLRIGAVVVGLLLLIALVIQIVLWTSFPKSLVVKQVEQGFGLRFSVKGLSTGWLGHTSMDGVTIALPLSQQSFVQAPSMRVHHTSLLGLLLGRPIEIKSVELDKPVIYVRQNAAGRWNLGDVAELLARAGGKKTGDQTAQSSATPSLPALRIIDMTVVVLDNKNRQITIAPVNVNGDPDTPAYKYDVEVPSGQANQPSHLSVLGRVAPGGVWQHQAKIWVHDVAPWIKPWAPSFNESTEFEGTWAGQLTAQGVSGFLQITKSALGPFSADGALSAQQAGKMTTLSLDNIHLALASEPDKKGAAPAKQLEVTTPAGTLEYDGSTVRATRMQLALLGGPATFNGWFEPATHQGALEAYWQNLTIGAGVTQSGKLDLTYTRPIAAPLRIELSAVASGTAPQGRFESAVKVQVTGNDFNDLTWKISAPQLGYDRPPQPVILNGLSAVGSYYKDARHQVLRLDKTSLPTDNRLAGSGFYDLTSKQGELHIEGQDWPLHFVEGTKLGFVLDAAGRGVASPQHPGKLFPFIDLKRFALTSGETSITAKATYYAGRPKPFTADVVFANAPTVAVPLDQPKLIRGYVRGVAHLTGTLEPRDIAIAGYLRGRNAEILGHPIGDVKTKLAGAVDDDKAVIRADGIPFLQGLWNFGATYVMKQGGKPVYATTVDFSVDRLPLPQVSKFLNAPRVDGVFAGHWYVYFPGLKPSATNLRVSGGGSIQNFAASYLTADQMTFTTSLEDGKVQINPIRLNRGSYGRIDAHAQLSLDQWRRITAGMTFTAFPIDIPSAGLGVQLWGGAVSANDEEADTDQDPITLLLPDPKSKDAAARIFRVDTDLNVRQVVSIESRLDARGRRTMQPLGEIRTQASMRGRTLRLTSVNGDLLGGTVAAQGLADLTDFDHLLHQTKIDLTWKDLQSDRMVRLYPAIKGCGGTYSGEARLQPANSPRALEPLAIDVSSTSNGGHWQAIKVGDAQLHLFLGPHRLIASDMQTSTFRLGGGAVDLWFTSSGHVDSTPNDAGQPHVTGITVSNQIDLTLHALDIDQFASAVDPKHPPGLGKLNGSILLLSAPQTRTPAALVSTAAAAAAPATAPATASASSPAQQQQDTLQHLLRTTTADGNLSLDQSDLGDFGPIAFLYNVMHLGGNDRTPTGQGTIAFHVEDGALHVTKLDYFNRGIEVAGVATVPELWKLQNSPIKGSVAGSASPLKSIRLPLFSEVNAVLVGLQNRLTPVVFEGTVKEPTSKYIKLLSLSELGSELRGVILGELGASSRK